MPHYTEDLSRGWLIVPLLILYLLDLGGVGFLGPDEPRYASIGREMARSGDLVTPRLDGRPWFEKPPLLYWEIAFGRLLRLPDEWAARLPVALSSVAFLVFFFLTVMRAFSPRTAIASTVILSTSAGWLVYSFVAVPDVLMSATLAAAIFITLFDTRPKQGYIAGALLGLSILAKAFVPVVLFAPVFLIARRRRLTILAGCIVVATPWYLLCWLRNGAAFWNELFWKQQVQRAFNPALQHVQPRWFYVPVLLAGLFPWTPLAGLLLRRKIYEDVGVRFLTAWIGFALVFFSLIINKLPGYVLPLLPPLAIVLAVALEKAGSSVTWWLTASALLLLLLPMIVAALPDALLSGVTKAHVVFAPGFPFLLPAAGVWWLAWRDKPSLALLTAAMTVVFAMAYVKGTTFPAIDDHVSVRGFWQANHPAPNVCLDESVRREWEYGLNYYAGHAFQQCTEDEPDTNPRITVRDGRLTIVGIRPEL